TEPAGAERGNRSAQQVNDVVKSGCIAKRRKVGRASLQVNHDCSGRCSVILAGGDGKRLLPLAGKLTDEDRSRRFALCRVQRVSYAVPQSNILLVLTRTHERFYVDQTL